MRVRSTSLFQDHLVLHHAPFLKSWKIALEEFLVVDRQNHKMCSEMYLSQGNEHFHWHWPTDSLFEWKENSSYYLLWYYLKCRRAKMRCCETDTCKELIQPQHKGGLLLESSPFNGTIIYLIENGIKIFSWDGGKCQFDALLKVFTHIKWENCIAGCNVLKLSIWTIYRACISVWK